MNFEKLFDVRKMFHGLLLLLLLAPALALFNILIPLTVFGSNAIGCALVLFVMLFLALPLIKLFALAMSFCDVKIFEAIKPEKLAGFSHGVFAFLSLSLVFSTLAAIFPFFAFLPGLVFPVLFFLSCLASPDLGK